MTITLIREVEFEVELEYHKGIKGHRDKYGAPEEPDDPDYWEVVSATVSDGSLSSELTEEEEQAAIQQAREECEFDYEK